MKRTQPYAPAQPVVSDLRPPAVPVVSTEAGAPIAPAQVAAGGAAPAAPLAGPALPADAELDTLDSLPRDLPAWQRDMLSVSARVRAALATLRPVVVRVLTFWDHAVRRVNVGGRSVEIDPSGCYRLL